MENNKAALTKTIAILLSTTPEDSLGKFLKLCLETKVDAKVSGRSPLQVAKEFMANPTNLSDWTEGLIYADGEVNYEEWDALQELNSEDPESFLEELWAELEKVNLQP